MPNYMFGYDEHAGNYNHTWYTLEELLTFPYDDIFVNRRGTITGRIRLNESEGRVMTYRECFGKNYFEQLETLKNDNVDVIVMSWD